MGLYILRYYEPIFQEIRRVYGIPPEVALIRIYLLLSLIIGGYVLVRKFLTAPKPKRDLYQKILIITGVTGLLVILAITGHLAWLTAMLGVIAAFVMRNLPVLVRYAPYLQRFWHTFRASKNHSGAESEPFNRQYRPKQSGASMSVAEAYKILGLESNASKQEIILAHKKLMQKMHPDRGGSDYLAAQINLAKDVLLKN